MTSPPSPSCKFQSKVVHFDKPEFKSQVQAQSVKRKRNLDSGLSLKSCGIILQSLSHTYYIPLTTSGDLSLMPSAASPAGPATHHAGVYEPFFREHKDRNDMATIQFIYCYQNENDLYRTTAIMTTACRARIWYRLWILSSRLATRSLRAWVKLLASPAPSLGSTASLST